MYLALVVDVWLRGDALVRVQAGSCPSRAVIEHGAGSAVPSLSISDKLLRSR